MLPMTLMQDPPVPSDGRCAVCGEPKLTADPESYRPTHLEQITGDPFCSAVCARVYHGVEQPSPGDREDVAPAAA